MAPCLRRRPTGPGDHTRVTPRVGGEGTFTNQGLGSSGPGRLGRCRFLTRRGLQDNPMIQTPGLSPWPRVLPTAWWAALHRSLR